MATAKETRTLVMDHETVQRKMMRIAHQIHEENFEQKLVHLVGIAPRGHQLAERLALLLKGASFKVNVVRLELEDKDDPIGKGVSLSTPQQELYDQTVVLVDDVLQSGRTLMYAAGHLAQVPLRKLCTVVLVDRRHRMFPIRADIVGLTLSTTLQERIRVSLGKKDAVYLE